MLLLFGLIATALYALAGWRIWRGAALPSGLLPLTLALHAAALSLQIFHAGSLRLGLAESVSLFAWQSALTLWVFSQREPLQSLGLVMYPFTGLCAVFGVFTSNTRGDLIPIGDWHLEVHILISLLAAGILSIACIQALALAVLERVLRHRGGGIAVVRRLPPLQTIERLLFQMVAVGFFLLSLALVTGLLFVHNLFAQHLAQKTVLSFCAWFIFGMLLWGRRRYGWRGRTAVRWVLSGYAMLVLAYFGSKLFIEQVLGTHWT